MNPPLPADIASTVRRALAEDVGAGDITAEFLPAETLAGGKVICREPAVLCGTAWFNEVFRQLDPSAVVEWSAGDGDEVTAGTVVCRLRGRARALLAGERTALNFVQLLSGTATATRRCVKLLEGSRTRLLDTRKTVPGLRTAQKYAVACGGGLNHRMGLYDAVLLKENHIRAGGGITAAVASARRRNRWIEVEVTTLSELEEALGAGAERIMLDNFDTATIREAVRLNAGRAELEASGGFDTARIREIAGTGVDYVSVGAITKDVKAVDFSMQFE